MNHRPHRLFLLCGAVALIAAGCTPDSPVSLDKYQTPVAATQATQSSPSKEKLVPPPPIYGEASTGEPAASIATSSIPSPVNAAMKTSPAPLAFPGILPASQTRNTRIRIKTTKGDIVFDLLPEEGPKAASNFVYLVKRKFYTGLTFHRVEPNFVIQGGDPIGNGTGGPGYTFEDDVVKLPYKEGIVAMANRGPHTNGSQFFIMLAETPLPPNYSIFGRVVQGMSVVKKIQKGDQMLSVTVEKR